MTLIALDKLIHQKSFTNAARPLKILSLARNRKSLDDHESRNLYLNIKSTRRQVTMKKLTQIVHRRDTVSCTHTVLSHQEFMSSLRFSLFPVRWKQLATNKHMTYRKSFVMKYSLHE